MLPVKISLNFLNKLCLQKGRFGEAIHDPDIN